MTPDPTPPGIHPTDAMLLLLGDVKSDTDATELMAELLLLGDVKSDTDATELMAALSLEAARAPTADDPFTPALVADAWRHLGACDQCSSRRHALLIELAPAISAGTADATTTSTLDNWVRAAVAELVPTTAAVPDSLARPAPSRRRRLAGPGGFGFGTASGNGGAIARPWIVGIAGAALLVAVGAAFALRPRSTEQSAVGTVPPRVERAARSDTTSLKTSMVAETEAAAANDAAMAASEVEDGPAPSTSAIGGAARAVSADPSFEELTPTPTAEAATGRDASPAEESIPAGASSKTTAASAPAVPAQAASSVPAQAARKKASLPAPAASAAVAAAPPAASEPQTATADLGTFADAASALDRFAARVATPTDVTAGQLESQPASGSSNASNTASPAVAPLPAATPSAEPVRCPAITGSPRLSARIGDRVVLVVRTTTADPTVTTADVVLDAATCVELARRTIPAAPSAPVGG